MDEARLRIRGKGSSDDDEGGGGGLSELRKQLVCKTGAEVKEIRFKVRRVV